MKNIRTRMRMWLYSACSVACAAVLLAAPGLPGAAARTEARQAAGLEYSDDGFDIAAPAEFRANGKLAFTRDAAGNGEVFVMNADGSSQTNITNHPAFDFAPNWSPDGTKLALTSNRDTRNDIYIVNGDGASPVTNLTNSPNADDAYPVWSPDGTKLVFVSSRDGNDEVYVMNANGSGPARLTNSPAPDRSPVWSPDGSKIAFMSLRDGNLEIYVMNADGSGQTRLTSNPASDTVPNWSPDGTKLAFTSDRDGDLEIFVMNSDGSGQVKITNNITYDSDPAWSPDGSKIAFTSQPDTNFEIFLMNADGSGQTNLTQNPAGDVAPAWQALPAASAVQFQSATYSASEGGVSATISVTRTGDLSGPASVTYRTVDDPAPVPCDPTSLQPNGQPYSQGTAYARCDYATTIDTLTFAANQAQKSFTIPLIDDAHVEGNETLQLRLSGPSGATLGGQATATLTLTDNDAAGAANPINASPFFVRMQYLDFLSREPDPGGYESWLGTLNNCPDPFNT
ncbi:MAG: Calx-beta domain-containing protein, partial [Pyrinomonadaceae bacterium]